MSAAEDDRPVVSPLTQATLVPTLLAWWDEVRADWPWRRSRDPYAIWVAEVMLQQTQIATVLPYYERWLARWPTLADLAAASLAEVLKGWEGLGYYRRARQLHAAAQHITTELEGRWPTTAAAWQRLPGVGPYTAGAIASIAFGQPTPAVDGNVMRVLTRLTDDARDISRPATRRALWQLATVLTPADRPGDFNQAMMELGQRLCTPTAPLCEACPAVMLCAARARGVQLARPVRPARSPTPHYHVVAGVIWDAAGRLLIAQRPLDGLLGGLWEFPGGKQEAEESLPAALAREIQEELGLTIVVGPHLTTVRHAFTHFRITLHAFAAYYQGGKVQHLGVADHAWVRLEDLDHYAFAAVDRQIIAHLRASAHQPSLEGIDSPTS